MTNSKWTRRDFGRVMAGGAGCALTFGRVMACGPKDDDAVVSFGVIADAQYCDADPVGSRHYRASAKKLAECVDVLNRLELAFVIHLGDFIDRDFASFAALLPVFDQLDSSHYHVLGNHDFAVAQDRLDEVAVTLGMPSRYYAFRAPGWRFVVLDGNDLSLHAHRKGSGEYQAGQAMHEALKLQQAPQAQTWNGAVGAAQMAWLDRELDEADRANDKVIIFCHFPAYPENAHNLWNSSELIGVLESHRCVVAYMNGHNHAGHYGQRAKIHYVTFPGMVETADSTAYAVVRARRDGMEIEGYGRVANRSLGW